MGLDLLCIYRQIVGDRLRCRGFMHGGAFVRFTLRRPTKICATWACASVLGASGSRCMLRRAIVRDAVHRARLTRRQSFLVLGDSAIFPYKI